MITATKGTLLAVNLALALGVSAEAPMARFGGYERTVRSGRGGPGPNAWDETNVWLFKGQPPKDQKEVEVVARGFKLTPRG